jgi:hypothetical protein
MGIIESFLNEYKSGLTKDEKYSISSKMLKYIIGSCFKKIHRRAFSWRSTCMIYNLTNLSILRNSGFNPEFPSDLTYNPDIRLIQILGTVIDPEDNLTAGEWLVTFHPFNDNLDSSLKTFLNLKPGKFQDIAPIFFDLFISSLYAYLCLMKRIHSFIKDEQNTEIPKYFGQFSNAIRIFYYVTHSNAMKIYFTGKHPLLNASLSRTYASSSEQQVDNAISKVYERKDWKVSTPEVKDEEDKEDKDEEGKEEQEDLYRRSFMSFVDHYSSLRLLERRCLLLPSGESIKLSLMTATHLESRYLPWDVMERLIQETSLDGSTSGSSDQEEMINKVKERILAIGDNSKDKVIKSFHALLAFGRPKKKSDPAKKWMNPSFHGSIHCESSLAAVLYQLHHDNGQENDLSQILQACPSSRYSSSLPDL